MTSTALDLSQIRTDATAYSSSFRTLIGLGTLATQSPTGTPSASNFLRGDYSWQTIDLSGYVPYTGATSNLNLGTYTLTSKSATLSTGTITASTPALDISQTWNNAAVTFTASKLNVVDTASASGSNLIDLQLNSVSQFKVVSGESDINGGSANKPALYSRLINVRSFYGSAFILNGASANNGLKIGQNTSGYLDITQNGLSIFNLTGYCNFSCESANVLAQRNVTNAQTFRLYNTYTDASNYERAVLDWQTTSNVFRIGTEAGGTGTVRNIALVGGNVGIGTTSPANPLDIKSSGHTRISIAPTVGSKISGIIISDPSGTGVSWYIDNRGSYDAPNGRLAFNNGSAEVLSILSGSSGNIGISQSSPAAKLDILDTTSAGSGSLAASTLNIASTWSTTGTPTLVKCNVVDTSSNAASLLMDLQVGGVSKFKVDKAGNAYAMGGGNTTGYTFLSNGGLIYGLSGGRVGITPNIGNYGTVLIGNGYVMLETSANISWNSASNMSSIQDLYLYRDAAATLAQRNGTNAQTFRLYGTYTDASNYRRLSISSTTAGAFTINAEGSGTGASGNTLELQTGGTSRLTFAASSHDITTDPTARLLIGANTTGRLIISNSANAQLSINQRGEFGVTGTDAVWYIGGWNTARPRLCFGGTTSSFPAIKAASTSINFRLADDSADCDITAAALTLSGNLTISTKNIVTDTTTGTKIGTGTTQKLGFYNATPVVQPTAVADATDAASVITQLNALLSRMRDLGLIAT